MTRSIFMSAIVAMMTSTASGAIGLGDADIPNQRIAVAFSAIGTADEVIGGLTVKEKTRLECVAGSIRRTLQNPGVSAGFGGGKGDRLTASECEPNASTD